MSDHQATGQHHATGKRRATGQYDVIVVGGGLAGTSLGLALAGAGLKVALLDRQDPNSQKDAAFDGRSSALSRASRNILQAIGVWPGLAPAAQPILDIRVSDGRIDQAPSRLFLHYDHRDAEPGAEAKPMGYIVENRETRTALLTAVDAAPSLDQLAPCEVTEASRGPDGVSVSLAGGGSLSARLLVAADGKFSRLRKAAGIAVTSWDYGQDGIVATIAHDLPHDGVAHEHFLPSGPFALLPMVAGTGVPHRSSLVWTERRALVPAIMALDEEAFNAELQRRFGDSLGALRLASRRWNYPLSLSQARKYRAERLVLLGDAAHAMHPIAGQGLNLALRDVAALAEILVDGMRLGQDPGDAMLLARYERWRRLDATVLLAATDGLNRLFSNDLPGLRLARDLGLAAVDRLPPVKRLFMRHAMGLLGDLPRLVKGEAL